MIELKITGANAEELINNARELIELLEHAANGAFRLVSKPLTRADESEDSNPAALADGLVAAGLPVEPPKTRGRPKKTETKPEPTRLDMPTQLDIEKAVAATYTLEEHIKPRLRAVITKKTDDFLKAGAPDNQAALQQTTDFVLAEIFTKFAIQKISQLPAVRYAAFMALTEPLA